MNNSKNTFNRLYNPEAIKENNEYTYLLHAELENRGMCFGKIRFDDKVLSDLIQKYCGPYGTLKEAQDAMCALSNDMLPYLEKTYPVPNTGLGANYNYYLIDDTYDNYLGIHWAGDTEDDFEPTDCSEEPYVLVSSISKFNLHFA